MSGLNAISNPFLRKLTIGTPGGVAPKRPVQAEKPEGPPASPGLSPLFKTEQGPSYQGGASLPVFGGHGVTASRLDYTV